MLTDSEKLLTRGAFEKLMANEAMSRPDMERLITVFERCTLHLDAPDEASKATILMRWRQVLQSRFFPQGQ